MGWRILVATDGSTSAEQAARLGALLAGDGAVHLLHAVSLAPVGPLSALDAVSTLVAGSPGSLAKEWELSREREGLELLEHARVEVERAGTPARIEAEQLAGRPADLILARAQEGQFDLIALGSHGRGTLARTILGSVSAEVLQHAERPVLFARRDSVRSLLVGVDGSEPGLRAAALAGEVARRTGAEVSFLYAAEVPIDTYVEGRARVKVAFEAEAQRAFEAARQALGVPVSGEHLVFHEPAHALVVRAEQTGVDLVVVGRRGRTQAPKLLLGSVSRRVALHAVASVLVVP